MVASGKSRGLRYDGVHDLHRILKRGSVTGVLCCAATLIVSFVLPRLPSGPPVGLVTLLSIGTIVGVIPVFLLSLFRGAERAARAKCFHYGDARAAAVWTEAIIVFVAYMLCAFWAVFYIFLSWMYG